MIKSRLKIFLIIIGIVLAFVLVTVFARNNMVSANTEDWYTDYEYHLKEDTIVLTKYIGTDTEIVVEPTVTIGENTYNVILNGAVFERKSSTAPDYTSIIIKMELKQVIHVGECLVIAKTWKH